MEKEDEFVTARNDVNLSIPKEISNGIKLGYNDKNVVLRPVIEESIEGVKEEETVVYKDAFGDYTELRYTPTLCGVKEDIVLSEYVPDTEYKFLIVADGKKLFSDEKGLYFSEDENKIEKIRLGDVIVFDNSGRFSEGELKVEENEDGSYLLTIIPDEEFLADPETVYPVIIDPSLTVSDNTHGANAIQDAPIFSGKPNQNFGNYSYDSIGTPNATYGVGRTVVRLKGLTDSAEFQGLTPSKISSVYFYVKEASGVNNQTIDLYPLGNSSWTETGVTWNNIGGYASINYGTTMTAASWASFNITDLARAWRAGATSSDKGFILKNATETNKESVFSSEHTTTASRPYVVMNYSSGIVPSQSSINLNVGATGSVNVNYAPTNYHLRWSSPNTRIAEVNATTGIITAKAPGRINIKVYFYEDNSIYANIALTVNPSTSQTTGISSGNVYRIKNVSKNKYLRAESTTEVGIGLYNNAMDGKQLWYVVWTGSGYRLYSMGIKNISSGVGGENETMLLGNPTGSSPYVNEYVSCGEWAISKSGNYYYLTNKTALYNESSLSASSSNSIVTCKSLANEDAYARWTFEKIESNTFNNYFTGSLIGQGNYTYVKINLVTTGPNSLLRNGGIDLNSFNSYGEWNGVSSHLIVYGPNDTVPSGITAFQVDVKGSTSISGSGKTNLYYNSTQVSIDEDATRAEILLDISTNSSLLYNEVRQSEVFLHEVGHVLKLAHPKEDEGLMPIYNGRGHYSGDNVVVGIMNQGNASYSDNLSCVTPKWHDKINLINRWGI